MRKSCSPAVGTIFPQTYGAKTGSLYNNFETRIYFDYFSRCSLGLRLRNHHGAEGSSKKGLAIFGFAVYF
jgi:hypothetical protein